METEEPKSDKSAVDTSGMSESDAIRARIIAGELEVGTIYEEPDPTPDPDHMVLRTDKLVKIYGSRKVVDGPSIMVRQGEIVGLLGPNGAGKTTTFYMTVGLIEPNEEIGRAHV